MRHSKIYKCWQHIKERCDNKNDKAYKNYGWRWIKYPDKWKKFIWFYEDMKDWYSDWLTIERINVDGNYSKENCCWITKQKQSENKRNTVYLEHNWERIKLLDLAKKYNIKYQLLYHRIYSYWLSIEESIIPWDRRGKHKRK